MPKLLYPAQQWCLSSHLCSWIHYTTLNYKTLSRHIFFGVRSLTLQALYTFHLLNTECSRSCEPMPIGSHYPPCEASKKDMTSTSFVIQSIKQHKSIFDECCRNDYFVHRWQFFQLFHYSQSSSIFVLCVYKLCGLFENFLFPRKYSCNQTWSPHPFWLIF